MKTSNAVYCLLIFVGLTTCVGANEGINRTMGAFSVATLTGASSGVIVSDANGARIDESQAGEDCAHPIVIPAVRHYVHTANTCAARNSIPFIGYCGGGNPSGPDIIYQFALRTAGTVSLRDSFTDCSQDVQIMVFTSCADPMGSCVASVDQWGACFEENISNLHLSANTYYVATSMRGTRECGNIIFEITSDVLLPVELISVVAVAGDQSVTLNWATASETDNARFEISRDGNLVGEVPSKGNDASGHEYTWTDSGLTNGTHYDYVLRAVDLDGSIQELTSLSATPNFLNATIAEYGLHQNYPNPFNPTTSIAIDLVEKGNVSLKVYNLMGQEVASVVNGSMERGRHIVNFNAASLSSGVYLYRLNVNSFVAEKKMLLMR